MIPGTSCLGYYLLFLRDKELSPTLLSADRCEFATNSRFLRVFLLVSKYGLLTVSPVERRWAEGVGMKLANAVPMRLELAYESERCSE